MLVTKLRYSFAYGFLCHGPTSSLYARRSSIVIFR